MYKRQVLESTKTISIPENLQGKNYLSSCYVIPQSAIQPYKTPTGETLRDAIVDNKRAVVSLREDTGSTNPGVTGSYQISLIELCLSVDADKGGRWSLGWEDTEREGTDSQCGMHSLTSIGTVTVNLA